MQYQVFDLKKIFRGNKEIAVLYQNEDVLNLHI